MITGTRHLSGLWPPFQAAVQYLLEWCNQEGLEGQIVSGYRSFQEQATLYRLGRTADQVRRRVAMHGANGAVTDAPPGASAHNYGLAVDIEGRDQTLIIQLAAVIGFGTVSWDPAHIEWPHWSNLL